MTIILYDRQSPREDWSAADLVDERQVNHQADLFRCAVLGAPGYEDYQVMAVEFGEGMRRFPDALPAASQPGRLV